uniref:Uncharacterized protein n=1 Tax=Physcomitrium patens TaxID=3218 RepID=A0A2K1KE68_PHYPA|nr:hypothetical protein PHYPA_008450 [Physcomitrium patens]
MTRDCATAAAVRRLASIQIWRGPSRVTRYQLDHDCQYLYPLHIHPHQFAGCKRQLSVVRKKSLHFGSGDYLGFLFSLQVKETESAFADAGISTSKSTRLDPSVWRICVA